MNKDKLLITMTAIIFASFIIVLGMLALIAYGPIIFVVLIVALGMGHFIYELGKS